MIGARNLTIWLTICSFLPPLVSTATGATLYVNKDGSGGAYTSIQEAIDDADPGDQIEVAPGQYDEAINFNGKAIKLYSTGGPDATIIDANGAYHVVQCVSGEGPDTILEGFTITGGIANGALPPDYCAGGMLNDSASPTVTNCTFSGNSALWGGGMYNSPSSNPTMTNCTFSGNLAHYGGGGMCNDSSSPTLINCTFSGNLSLGGGGGMDNFASNPTVTDCTFSGNSTPGAGGGMHNSESNPAVTDCTFSDNSAGTGGAMSNLDVSSPTVTNCTFSGNSVTYAGGGIENLDLSSPTVTNCTFSGNSATHEGGGMYNENSSPTVTNCTFIGNSAAYHAGGICSVYASTTVTNCILWSDSGGEIYGSATVTYSDVQEGTGQAWFGEGCIDSNPMFADAAGRLAPGSPCIDSGNSLAVPAGITTDLDGNPRIQGVAVDMGAFEAIPPETLAAALAAVIIDDVESGAIAPELQDALLAKVNAAISALDRDNPNDAKVAVHNLKALINQVEAQAGKKITPEAAAAIIASANAIIASLGG